MRHLPQGQNLQGHPKPPRIKRNHILKQFFNFLFGLAPSTCGILVPLPGIEPAPSAVKARCSLDRQGSPPFFSFNFWLRQVFIAAHRLPLVVASGGYSLSRCAGFSLRWLLLLQSPGSRRVGFSSCGTRAQ